jgi:hypothetical protein
MKPKAPAPFQVIQGCRDLDVVNYVDCVLLEVFKSNIGTCACQGLGCRLADGEDIITLLKRQECRIKQGADKQPLLYISRMHSDSSGWYALASKIKQLIE